METKESYIFGNITDQDIVFPDLIVGTGNTGPAFKLQPGEVVNFEEFFSPQRLKRARSIAIAKERGLIKECAPGEVIEVKKRIYTSGPAPKNEFDILLEEELKKEQEEQERLRASSIDVLGSRNR